MLWYQVVIEKEKTVADIEGAALINKVDSAYRKAGVPDGVKVYRCQTPSGGHIYYFNPAAALVAEEVLPLFDAGQCLEVPNLDGCTPVRFSTFSNSR